LVAAAAAVKMVKKMMQVDGGGDSSGRYNNGMSVSSPSPPYHDIKHLNTAPSRPLHHHYLVIPHPGHIIRVEEDMAPCPSFSSCLTLTTPTTPSTTTSTTTIPLLMPPPHTPVLPPHLHKDLHLMSLLITYRQHTYITSHQQ